MAFSCRVEVSGVVTALTAQNSKKFYAAQVVRPEIFKKQFQSILPLSQYQAIKIGMLGNEKIIQVLLTVFKKEKKIPPVILDPVLQSSTGGVLLNQQGRILLWKKMLSHVALWTPNLEEASYYYGSKIFTLKHMKEAADDFWNTLRVPVLIKGGHLKGQPQDLFYDGIRKTLFSFPRVKTKNIRGTGCALSTLITSFVAQGFPLLAAVKEARQVLQGWLSLPR